MLNIDPKLATSGVLNSGTEISELQPVNMFDMFVTKEVSNNGTVVSEGHVWNIPCMFVTAEVFIIVAAISEGHAWNIVFIRIDDGPEMFNCGVIISDGQNENIEVKLTEPVEVIVIAPTSLKEEQLSNIVTAVRPGPEIVNGGTVVSDLQF